jgi:hypothetical protein
MKKTLLSMAVALPALVLAPVRHAAPVMPMNAPIIADDDMGGGSTDDGSGGGNEPVNHGFLDPDTPASGGSEPTPE